MLEEFMPMVAFTWIVSQNNASQCYAALNIVACKISRSNTCYLIKNPM